MKVIAAADEAHDIRKAKSPSGMVNAVEEALNYLGALVDSHHGDQATHGEAYATTSDSDRLRRSQRKRHIFKEKRNVGLHNSGRLHDHLLPHHADTKIAGVPNVAPNKLTRRTSPRMTATIVRNLAASSPTRMSLRHLAVGTRKESRGVQNGSARKWTSTTSSAPSFLRRKEATPVVATRVMAGGVGI